MAENGFVDPNTEKAFTGEKALYRQIMRTGKLKYVFEPRQCGPISRNAGARLATGDYVLFCDAHTSPGKLSIEPLVELLEDDSEVGGVSGLTAWSHYTFKSLGSYYELFHPAEKRASGRGGPTLRTHMHGHYMALGRIRPKELKERVLRDRVPFSAVMGSQAYTMYRRKEFLDIGGYFEGCRYYPHPEGYMPLKMWLIGKRMMVHPDSWHLHGMYPRTYAANSIDRDAKIKEYGGHSWQWHGRRNVLMVAWILGGDKWMRICYDALWKPSDNWASSEIVQSALATVQGDDARTLQWFRAHREMSLDDVLTMARRERIPGMENWFDEIGKDPLGL